MTDFVGSGLRGSSGVSGIGLPDVNQSILNWDGSFNGSGISGALPNQFMSGYPSLDYVPSVANTAAASGVPGLSNGFGFLQQKNADGTTWGGWGSALMSGAQGIGNAYMGMKQFGLAKDALAMQKSQFENNFGAQRQATNTQLEDRQRARIASNSSAYQSVGDYMNQNRIA